MSSVGVTWGRPISIVVFCFFIAGCGYTRHRPMEYSSWPPVDEANPVEVGKSLKVVTVDGTVLKGEVDSVDKTEFVIDGNQVLFSQVELVHTRTFLWAPTLAIAGVVGFFVYIASPSPRPVFDDN